MSSNFGTLDRMLGLLSETRAHRYSSKRDRECRFVLFARGGMQVTAGEVENGLIRVTYESAPHELVEELCTTEQAAALIDALMVRKQLCRVPKPNSDRSAPPERGDA